MQVFCYLITLLYQQFLAKTELPTLNIKSMFTTIEKKSIVNNRTTLKV